MEDDRKLCEPIFNPSKLRKPTKTSLWEKVQLFFLKKQFEKDEWTTRVLVFKILRNKIYIIDEFVLPPNGYNCRSLIQSKN